MRRIRLEKRLTQEQFAEQSGFTQQYLSGLERGRRNPTIVSLYEIALALGVEHVALVIPDDEAVKEEGRRLKPDGNEMNVLRTHAQVRHPTKSVRPRAKQVRKES